MTKIQPRDEHDLVVVDGSNIATEGRSTPSLAQLNEAVLSFREEYPNVNITVVVDATFGHRIDKSEVAEFDAAVAHNELVAPPAGAVGRGDAFVLSIANKSGARILSNDSFQEFHGTYPWLFDDGRLIGGKPVPYVGWVFVSRVPVKGPISRKARATASDTAASRTSGGRVSRTASKLASQPMPVPTSPPPGPPPGPAPAKQTAKATKQAAKASAPAQVPTATVDKTVPARGGPVNELLPFIDFVQHHPIGSSVTGVVESYSSHGAYVTIGDLRGYVPLRLMGNPPPRSAREVMKQGEMVTLVVDSFAAGRRSVDLALPGFGVPPAPAPAKRARKASAAAPAGPPVITEQAASTKKAASTKQAAATKKAAATTKAATTKKAAKTVSKKSAAATDTATKRPAAPVKKQAAKKAARQAAPRKAASKTS
jgi:hypothetical protein